MEFSLLGAVVVAIVPLYVVAKLEAKIGNSRIPSRNLTDLAVSAILAGVLVGRLSAMVLDGVNPVTHPADILIIRGGVATVPATIAALATVAWYARDALWPVADSLAAPALAGLGGWHTGCVVRGSCLGTTTDLPWGLSQSGSTIGRHPVEIYAAGLLIGGAIAVLLWRHRAAGTPGVAAVAAFAWAAVSLAATEPLRPSLGTALQYWYLFGAVGGVLLVVWRYRSASDTDEQPAPGPTD